MKFLDKLWSTLGLYEYVEEDEQKEQEKEPLYNRKPEIKSKTNLTNIQTEDYSWGKKQHLGSATIAHNQNSNNVVPLPVTNKPVKMMVVEPTSFDDAQKIADYIRESKPVVVNFEKTPADVMKRIIDFISGTIYALNGNIQLAGNTIMVCAPNNVDIDVSKDFLSNKDFSPWRQ